MITFSRIGEYGRLGNQLFQYAILVAVGTENDYEIKIPSFDNKFWHGQKCLLDNFNITAKKLTNKDRIQYLYEEPDVDRFKFNSSVFNVPDNCDLFGFFQNYQYYKKYENLITKELTPKAEVIDRNEMIMAKIKEKYPDYLIVSLHIRRGDANKHECGRSMFGSTTTKLDVNASWYKYFTESKKYFNAKKCKFLVFTGGERIKDDPTSDYTWCKNNLIGDEFIFWDYDNTTMNDFTLMYLSDAHILSPISSLSWWVGFLNKQKNKTIIAPEKYNFLVDKMVGGFYPDKFILV